MPAFEIPNWLGTLKLAAGHLLDHDRLCSSMLFSLCRTDPSSTPLLSNSRYNETRYNEFHSITHVPTGTDLAP
jgi:hypothetical protein